MIESEIKLPRFWKNVLFKNGCWLWTGAKQRSGYGAFTLNGSTKYTHRLSYEFFYNTKIPASKCLDHLCETRACINPLHLELTTLAENTKRNAKVARVAKRLSLQNRPHDTYYFAA